VTSNRWSAISIARSRPKKSAPNHFAYSTFAKAAAQRRDNLPTSAGDLKVKLDAARRDRDEALDELRRLEATEQRDGALDRSRGRGDRPEAAAS
jgi:flagellar protein FliJ